MHLRCEQGASVCLHPSGVFATQLLDWILSGTAGDKDLEAAPSQELQELALQEQEGCALQETPGRAVPLPSHPCHCSQSSTDAFVLHLISFQFCICTSTRAVHLGDQVLVQQRPAHVLDPRAMGSPSFATLWGGQRCQRSVTPMAALTGSMRFLSETSTNLFLCSTAWLPPCQCCWETGTSHKEL